MWRRNAEKIIFSMLSTPVIIYLLFWVYLSPPPFPAHPLYQHRNLEFDLSNQSFLIQDKWIFSHCNFSKCSFSVSLSFYYLQLYDYSRSGPRLVLCRLIPRFWGDLGFCGGSLKAANNVGME